MSELKKASRNGIPEETIFSMNYLFRKEKFLSDRNQVDLYGVETNDIKRQFRPDTERFPDDFMFKLNVSERHSLRPQLGTLKREVLSKYLPFAFTEQGVSVLRGVLNTPGPIEMNISKMGFLLK
jgi:hypothetical protein